MKYQPLLFLCIFLQLSVSSLYAQNYFVEALVTNLPPGMAYLYSYADFKYQQIDSTEHSNGAFYFSLTDKQEAAMMQIRIKNTHGNFSPIEFLWNKENLQIEAGYADIEQSLQLQNSIENELLSEFYLQDATYQQKMNILLHTLDHYPEKDSFYLSAIRTLDRIQTDRNFWIDSLVQKNKNTLASRIINKQRSLKIPIELKKGDRANWMQSNYFHFCSIDDPSIGNTPFYSKKIITFLKLATHPSMSYSELEKNYIEAVDVIMNNTNDEMRAKVVEYLIEGFESLQMESVQTYLYDHYVSQACTTDKLELAKERIEAYKKMAIGELASDISTLDLQQKSQVLSELNSDYTLVLFWASHCAHCRKMMPKLIRWYKEEKTDEMDVFAVSIDTISQSWEAYSNEIGIPFTNTLESLGWEGASASDYNIYATPSMFILNNKREIIARPVTFRELKLAVKDLK